MTMENRKPLILAVALIIIAIFLTYLWFSGSFQMGMTNPQNSSVNFSPAFIDTNSSPSKLPLEIQQDIQDIARDNNFTINKWDFDPVKKNEFSLFVHDIRNESSIENLQGKQIGNYTIYIIHDTEFETTRSEVITYLTELKKDPDYQISGIYMVTDRIDDPPGNYAELWVYKSTPENKKLDNTIINGWKIRVYPMTPMPTEKRNATGSPSET